MTVITGKARIGQMQALNVRDFGALGDNTHDDTTNIQNAVNALAGISSARGAIFFPSGEYKVTAPIDLTWLNGTGGAQSSFRIYGTGYGSIIIGNVPGGYLLQRNNTVLSGYDGTGDMTIEHMNISNSSIVGGSGAIMIASNTSCLINSCAIQGSNGIVLNNGLDGGNQVAVKSGMILNCRLASSGKASSGGSAVGTGITMGSGCCSHGNDIGGFKWGHRISGAGTSIIGGRCEVCTTAIITSLDIADNVVPATAFVLYGATFESNDTTLDFTNGLKGAEIGGCSITSLDGHGVDGIVFPSDDSASNIVMKGQVFQGGWSGYNIRCPGSGPNSMYRVFIDITAVNAGVGGGHTGAGQLWQMPTGAYVAQWINCNNPDPVFTFANLPGGGTQIRNKGDEYMINDSPTAPSGNFYTNVTVGGGANVNRVRWNGSNWVIV